MKKPVKHRKAKIVLITIASLFIAFLCIPVPRFDKPYSTVLTAKNGELLGAKIADDGQWRFPVRAEIVAKPEDYLYSSALNYVGEKGLLNVEVIS